jgi:type II secretion system protein H
MKRAPFSASGFTLLELLVVITIIGIVTAGVLFSINFAGKDTDLETESKRLHSLMDYAREQAELQTRDYGIYFGQHGYEFVVYDVRTGAWRRVFEDDALRDRTLPGGLDFKLTVDARPIVLNETMAQPPDKTPNSQPGDQSAAQAHPSVPHTSSNSDSDSNAASKSNSDSPSGSDPDSDPDSESGSSFAPQVMIFSSGDLSSFTITMERPSAGRSITLDENQDGDIVQKPMVQGRGEDDE